MQKYTYKRNRLGFVDWKRRGVCDLFYWLLLVTWSGLLYGPIRLTSSLGTATIRVINRYVTINIGAGVV